MYIRSPQLRLNYMKTCTYNDLIFVKSKYVWINGRRPRGVYYTKISISA